MRLDEIIGKKITLSLVRSKNPYILTLRGVEAGGIWVEGGSLDALTGHKSSQKERPKSPKPPTRPVVFIPYPQVVFAVYHSTDLGE